MLIQNELLTLFSTDRNQVNKDNKESIPFSTTKTTDNHFPNVRERNGFFQFCLSLVVLVMLSGMDPNIDVYWLVIKTHLEDIAVYLTSFLWE